MLEIEEEKFKAKFFGEVLEIRYPTGEEVEATQEALQSDKGKELKTLRDLFIKLGMNAEITSKLQITHYNKIFEALLQKKS